MYWFDRIIRRIRRPALRKSAVTSWDRWGRVRRLIGTWKSASDQQEVFIASGSHPLEVAFLDVSRRQWRRTVQGELEELKELLGGFC